MAHFRVVGQRHHNKPYVCVCCLRPLTCVVSLISPVLPPSSTVSLMLLNTRSLNNKAPLINDIITDRKLDFLLLTVTEDRTSRILLLSSKPLPLVMCISRNPVPLAVVVGWLSYTEMTYGSRKSLHLTQHRSSVLQFYSLGLLNSWLSSSTALPRPPPPFCLSSRSF